MSLNKQHVPRLCENCWRIIGNVQYSDPLPDTAEGRVYLKHLDKISDLFSGAKKKCIICLQVFRECSRNGQYDLEHFVTKQYLGWFSECRWITHPEDKERHQWKLDIEVHSKFLQDLEASTTPWEYPGVTTFYLHPLKDIPALPEQSEYPNTTAAEPCWNQISQWLGNCQRSHKKCNAVYRHDLPAPTRLLDVGHSQSPSDSVCLITTAEQQLQGRYATLSHCWGSVTPIRLDKSTYSRLSNGVDMADLPPTFRDAVSAVRRLGLRYLWIDSLCILQDSDEDWRREAGRMQNVYRNAYCNLAASGSHNVLGGLIKTRDPTLIFPCVVSFASNLHSEEEWLIIPENWWESFTETRLNRRGWIVQERLLAARVIHFGSDQLHWECHELDACESFPNGIPLSGSLRSTAYKGIDPATDGVRLRARYGRLAQDDTGLEALYLWSRVISLYTDCQLTKESDKLIALAGLAGQFSTLMPEAQYLAGLWSTHLACQLLWSVDVLNDKPAAKYPAAYRAPSWSWAAVDAHIEPATITSQGILIEIKQFTIIPSPPDSLDTMFQVSSGSLTIQGNLVKAQQKITPRRSPWTSEILQSIILDSSTPIPRVSANFDVLDVILAHTSSLPHSQASSSFFFLLPVRKYVYAATHWVAGLILVDVNDKPIANASNSAGTKDRAGKAEDKKKGVYRRVGKFTTSGKGAESFIELVENSGNQGNGSTEEEKDGEDTLGTFILQ